MIRSFSDKDTEKIWNREYSKAFPREIQSLAKDKLMLIHSAENIDDLRSPPGNRLEKLKGDRSHQYSIRINNKWRICFIWQNENAHSVEIVDYH